MSRLTKGKERRGTDRKLTILAFEGGVGEWPLRVEAVWKRVSS